MTSHTGNYKDRNPHSLRWPHLTLSLALATISITPHYTQPHLRKQNLGSGLSKHNLLHAES